MMLHPYVPIVLTLFLLFFLILAGFAVTLLFAVLRLFRQHLTREMWKGMDRDDLVNRQTVDAVHWTQLHSMPHHLPDNQI